MKNRFMLFLIVSGLIVIQFWFLTVTFTNAYYGVELSKNSNNEWVVTGYDPDATHYDLGLQVGDIIIRADGKAPDNNTRMTRFHSLEQTRMVTIMRDGTQHNLVLVHNGGMSFDYISLFGEIICFCLAGLIYLRIPPSRSSRLLLYLFILMAIVCMSLSAGIRTEAFAKFLVTLLVTALPIVLLHFQMVFFKEKSKIHLPLKLVYVLYGFVALRTITTITYFFPFYSFELYKVNNLVTVISFLFGMLINIMMLIYIDFKYSKENKSVRPIIKFVWFAFFISSAPLVIFSFIPIAFGLEPILLPSVTCFFILIFPSCFAYLIVTKQLYDVQIIIRRIYYTTLISLIPTVLIVILQGFIFNQTASLQKLFYSFLLILTIISFLLYLLEYFVTKLDSIMFPHKYQLQLALNKIAQNLRTIRSFRELKEIILVDIVQTLQVHGGAIIFKTKETVETIGNGYINLVDLEQHFNDGNLDAELYSVYEINRNEEYSSFLVTTRKKNNTLLGLEETQWLSLIITYLAVNMENLYLIRKLTLRLQELASQIPDEASAVDIVWLRKSLFELQERERFRIATDLHGTTLQDVLLIKNRLIAYMDNGEDRLQLLSILKHLDLVNDSLRQSCFELNPYLLERIGLIKTVEAAIERDIGSIDFDTSLEVKGSTAIESMDIEIKKHIFRIIQELFQNAKKHSNASKVSLMMSAEDGEFCLFYNDDGIGMDNKASGVEGNLRTLVNSGLGLDQIQSRIIFLHGQMKLVTGKDSGVKITIHIPIQQMLVTRELPDQNLKGVTYGQED